MRRPSSITRLSPKFKVELDKLIKGGMILDDIVAAMRDLGAGLSRSAVHRYRKSIDKVIARARETRAIAAGFAQELGEIPEGDTGRLLTEMLRTLIFEVLMKRGEDEDQSSTKELMQLARAIRDNQAAFKASAELEMKIRRDIAEKAAQAAAKVAKRKGLTAEAIEEFRQQVLGVVS